ncbi:MFS transporter [Cellulomonas denverensis]|uniref:MFS transporter n=1 Tax=Cellulomonas denverensis TaxID=264297 RepID=A0A7X6R015_9CELL|nr:MFS transporter [Cellulomonas denverensis]NKY23829.1 MFS transporter [Cellulomonas denverensis]GIG25163.1 MFS transporter [Cellulomonas denverensis]
MSHVPHPRRALLVWGVAVAAYVVAILNRSSFGVATIEVRELFGVSSALIASMAVAQLVVYAALQVPVGVLLDRYGPRVLIATGALVMAIGQAVLALAPAAGWVLAGRVLVGAGDALTFVSVVRLVPAWFAPRQVPVLTQLTGSIGQLGQVLSAIPVVALLHAQGWRTTFLSVAALGVLATALALAVIRDEPPAVEIDPDAPPGDRVGFLARLRAASAAPRDPGALRAVLAEPGTRLAFWMHFSGQFSNHVVVLLWGYAFFVEGEGLSAGEASALLTLNVVAGVVAGPVIGALVGRRPRLRMPLAVGTLLAIGAVWLAVLVPAVPVPWPVLALFVVVVAVGGPISLVSFDVARSSNPVSRLGTATGFVNTGGFIGAFVTMLVIGLLLDRVGGGVRDLDAFRVAFACVAVPWVVGMAGMLHGARVVRRRHPGIEL